MAVKEMKGKVVGWLKKYKFAFLIFAVGMCLLLIPGRKESTQTQRQETPVEEKESTEEKLEKILSKIDGAGEIKLMLTASCGEEYLYQTDNNASSHDESDTVQSSTVTVTDKDRAETGLVRQVIPEKYLGAVIVCKGADKPGVRLAIVDAVAKITGLGADRISVVKMK